MTISQKKVFGRYCPQKCLKIQIWPDPPTKMWRCPNFLILYFFWSGHSFCLKNSFYSSRNHLSYFLCNCFRTSKLCQTNKTLSNLVTDLSNRVCSCSCWIMFLALFLATAAPRRIWAGAGSGRLWWSPFQDRASRQCQRTTMKFPQNIIFFVCITFEFESHLAVQRYPCPERPVLCGPHVLELVVAKATEVEAKGPVGGDGVTPNRSSVLEKYYF